jgi:long-subunit acyl-CoA synthetase (AMP-forming)
MFRDSVNRFPNSNCLGYRPELGIKQITKTVEHEGKSVEKSFNVTKKQRAFQWQTYQQVYDEVLLLGSGLASTGLKPGDAVSI